MPSLSEANRPFFRLKKVSVRASSRYILENINFSIPEGAKVVILGESGSGKSTLAKLLKGLIKSFTGKILIDGLNPSFEKERRQIVSRVGLVFSNPSQQLIAPKVKDDIRFGLENQGLELNIAEKRIDDVLTLFGILDLKEEMTYNLSMGEQLKVAAAGVIAMMPQALILDEPGVFVDHKEFKHFISSIIKFQKRKKQTLVWISHNPEDIFLADLLLVLSHGKMYYFGCPNDFFSKESKNEEKKNLFPEIFNLAASLEKHGIIFDKFPKSLNDLLRDLCP